MHAPEYRTVAHGLSQLSRSFGRHQHRLQLLIEHPHRLGQRDPPAHSSYQPPAGVVAPSGKIPPAEQAGHAARQHLAFHRSSVRRQASPSGFGTRYGLRARLPSSQPPDTPRERGVCRRPRPRTVRVARTAAGRDRAHWAWTTQRALLLSGEIDALRTFTATSTASGVLLRDPRHQ